jgi:hypothetical protein
MIDAILTNTMLPEISREFLTRTMRGEAIGRVRVTVADADFAYRFGDGAPVTAASADETGMVAAHSEPIGA